MNIDKIIIKIFEIYLNLRYAIKFTFNSKILRQSIKIINRYYGKNVYYFQRYNNIKIFIYI